MSHLPVPGEQGEGKVRAVSNPLPGLASLNFSNHSSDAQQDYEAAQASRADVTMEEIEQRGIAPDVKLIEREILRPKTRVKRSGSTAHKVFSKSGISPRDSSGSGDVNINHSGRSNVNILNLGLRTYPSNQEQDEVVNTLWGEFARNGGLNGLNQQQVTLLYQHWNQRALAINESAKEWKALNVPEPVATKPSASTFDLFGSLLTDFELLLEVCKHLRPIDIINLYSVSKSFHELVNANLQSTILLWTDHMAPASARIFCNQLYFQHFVDDPSGRDPRTHRDIRYFNQPAPIPAVYENQHGNERAGPVNPERPEGPQANTRKVPSLIWFQMVVDREIKVRDILATLARHGHRTPPKTHETLKKLWLLMDVASCIGRAHLIRSKTIFTDEDIYRARLFFIKLYLLFMDPVFGPKSTALARLFLGQKGFTPLWQFLRRKKYTTEQEIVEMKTRYDVRPTLQQRIQGRPINGVPPSEMGRMHVEGWGLGTRHLLSPDQMVTYESYKRQLPLHLRTERMMLYGHVDFKTGQSLVPSLDELYMGDDEFDLPADSSWRIMKHRKAHGGCGNVPFERSMWQPKHARKARWNTLTEEEKEDILAAEEEEISEAKKLRYVQGDLDVALADLEEALYDYAVEKEEGSHEEHGIDGLWFDSRVPMPDDASPSDEEEDFDDEDWENCAKYMEGLDASLDVPDQLTLIRQGHEAHNPLSRSIIKAKQVFDDYAKNNASRQQDEEDWILAVAYKMPLYTGQNPSSTRSTHIDPFNMSFEEMQAFRHIRNDGQPQAERADVRAEYLLKAAAALHKARLDTGDLDRLTDAMPDDEVAELEDEMLSSEIEDKVNYRWMLHMPGTHLDNGGGGNSQDEDEPMDVMDADVSMLEDNTTVEDKWIEEYYEYEDEDEEDDEDDDEDDDEGEDDDEDDDEEEDDDDDDDLITGDFSNFGTTPGASTSPNQLNPNGPHNSNQPTPNPYSNTEVPFPSQMYNYAHDPDQQDFDWRAWLDMQRQNELLSETAKLDPSLLNGAHEIGQEELRMRVERTIQRTQGHKNHREMFLRRYYRQW